MGTRSLTVFVDASWDKTEEICVMYRQFDGYLSGHGKDLCDFLRGMQIVNGIRMDQPKPFANGAGCMAAQVIAHFKKDAAGGYYLHPAGTRNCGEEFTYTVTAAFNKPLNLRVDSYGKSIYDGPLDAFNPETAEAA